MKDECFSISLVQREGEEKILDHPPGGPSERGGVKNAFPPIKKKLCLIDQKEGQKWIPHAIVHLKMTTDVLYFFSCCTV